MNQIQITDVIINAVFTVIGAVIGVLAQRHFDKKNRKEDQLLRIEEENKRKTDEEIRIKQQVEDDIRLLTDTFFMTAKTLESYRSGLCNFGFDYFERETPRMIEILNGNCKMLQQRDINKISPQMKTRFFFAKQMIDANINNLRDDVRLMGNSAYKKRINKVGTIEQAIEGTTKQIDSFNYAAEHPTEFLDLLAENNKVE